LALRALWTDNFALFVHFCVGRGDGQQGTGEGDCDKEQACQYHDLARERTERFFQDFFGFLFDRFT
jgi:hypothetical protein